MEEERIFELKNLKTLLKNCEIKDDVINQITEVCKSRKDLYTNENAWSKLVTEEEQIRIIKSANFVRHATIDFEEYVMLTRIKEKNIDYNDFLEYAEKYGKEVDEEIKKYKRGIYKLAFKIYFKSKKSRSVVNGVTGGAVLISGFLKNIVPQIIQIAKSNPNLTRGIVSSIDEFLVYCQEFSMTSAIKGNIYSGAIIFGLMTTYSIAKNLYDWYKGKICAKQCLTLIAVDIAANGASALTTTIAGVLGSLIGSIIPGVGTLIGGIVGGLIGAFIANKCVDPYVKQKLAGKTLAKLQSIEMDKLYENALEEFHAHDELPADNIKKLRREYVLCNHPDKQNSLNDAITQKFIRLEACYKIIEAHRIAKGTWK